MSRYVNSVNITSGRRLNTQEPMDDRLIYADFGDVQSDVNAAEPLRWYEGMEVAVLDTLKVYRWIDEDNAPVGAEDLGVQYTYPGTHPDPIYAGKTFKAFRIPSGSQNHSDLNLDDGTNPHGTTKADVGLGNVPNIDTSLHSNITLDDGTNPHGTTKADVGLGNVDNTPDANKPVSNPQQAALDDKQNLVPSAGLNQIAIFTTGGQIINSTVTVADLATTVDLDGKMDKIDPTTADNFVVQDGNGNVIDSGVAPSDFIQSGDNVSVLVNDAGYLVAGDIANKMDKVPGAISGNLAEFNALGQVKDAGVVRGEVMKWKNEWDSSATYTKSDVVEDEGWLMIANKTTTDRPAPRANGNPVYSLPDDPTWDSPTPSNNSVVYSGHQYIFKKSGWIQEVRIWVPELTPDTNYRVIIADITNPGVPNAVVIEEPVLNLNAWTTVALGSQIATIGSTFLIYIDALNSGSSTNVSGGWRFDGNSQNSGPADQGWNRDNQGATVRIDKTDLDSVDRSAELGGVIPGSTIRFAQTADPNNYQEFLTLGAPIDLGDYYQYNTSLVDAQGTIGVLDNCTVDIDIPISASTQYVELTNQWLTQPDFADVSSFLQFDGVDQGNAVEAYGVDIKFQDAYVSPDWDFMSTASLSAGGSSSLGQPTGDADINVLGGTYITREVGGEFVIELTQALATYTLAELNTINNKNGIYNFVNVSGDDVTIETSGTDTIYLGGSAGKVTSTLLSDGSNMRVYLRTNDYKVK